MKRSDVVNFIEIIKSILSSKDLNDKLKVKTLEKEVKSFENEFD